MKTQEANWAEARDSAWAGKTETKRAAWYNAKVWVYFFEARKADWFLRLMSSVSAVLRGNVMNSAHKTLVSKIFEAIESSNAQFFRDFADALEIKARVRCGVRAWLVKKHCPDDAGVVPKFTHPELLNDADSNGIEIDERQLRRLMVELAGC